MKIDSSVSKTPTISVSQPLTGDLINKIERFRLYRDNWGTYNEKAVKGVACDRARNFVAQFAFFKPLVRLDVYPTSGGDIGVEWKEDKRDYAAIFSEKDFRLLIDMPEAATKVDMIEQAFDTEPQLLMALELLQKFLEHVETRVYA
jgi:hypothetical protein